MNSKRFRLNKKDLAKIGKGSLIAGGGAMVAYLLVVLTEVDFGSQTPIIVAIGSIILNAVLKLLRNGRNSVVNENSSTV